MSAHGKPQDGGRELCSVFECLANDVDGAISQIFDVFVGLSVITVVVGELTMYDNDS